VRRSLWWMSSLSLVALAVLAAATPPNLSKTLETQRRLAAERPQDPAVFNDLGNLLLLARRPAEAEEAYRRAVELDPERVSALFNLGLLEQQKGELREAHDLYERVVEKEPRHAWAHYQLGAIYESWDRESQAIKEYAKAFALDPQLAFPDVNPHVIDNKLVTEAMLKAYRAEGQAPQAPAVYEEPQRIATLLDPPPVPAGEEGAEAVAEGQPGAPAATGTTTATGATKPPTVLRERNLEPGKSSGQIAAPGSSRSVSRPSTTTRPSSVRTWARPEPTFQPELEEVPEEGGEPEAPEVYVPPGGVVYRPGLPSSGRLDLKLMPEPEPVRIASARAPGRRG
jgi:hypothetical protein